MTAERQWHVPEERDRLGKKEWRDLYIKQNGRCACGCGTRLEVKGGIEVEVEEGDGPLEPAIDEHVQPLSLSGSNKRSNRQLWAKGCAAVKTAKEAPIRAKSNRVRDKFIGTPKPKSKRAMPGSRNHPSGLRKRMSGDVEQW